ncbi:hypothetical protein [Curtobacterium sp. ME26]|uniref:hypothetical protein n=1 Tax=Curtobacterium sp. ME26 TaxID=2744254 RepID=UPI0015F6D559|nr:hypothetical protein [Curtobacterium sp. ME26]
MYADELAELRPAEVQQVPLFAELLLQAAREGDSSAVRLLGTAQHLVGLGYESLEQVDSGLLREVDGVHGSRLARQPSTSPARMLV